MKTKILAFLLPLIAFWIIGGYFLLNYSKTAIHLFFNEYHSAFGDSFFVVANFFGEWQFMVIAILMCAIFKNYYSTLLMFVAFVFNGMFVQFLKKIIFPEYLRPKPYFEKLNSTIITKLNFVTDVEINSYNSFPSGHTTQAFTIFLVLALLSKNSFVAFVCFCLALLSGFSRIYLQQHFLGDVYAGSIIATFLTFIFFFIFEKYLKENEKLKKRLF